ncbi:transcriptional regulator [Segetibacter sp. 3557_3]|jgi:putative transcriptional regulator|uniref:helix-turn-helix transcriptional regulator n=1 Tax=Segetibacter sp. 3557_3 TaxID=2547429 RepID=UPI00105909BD|nr:helix-turn-helix transcriptional regulator [Segetibacter sp. 3557_3]TDH26949.1 transcriptional regulator [Segetibacter sp. 3557_3]
MVNKLKHYREQHGFTQEQLATAVGVSRQSIISIEKGQYVPTTLLALKLASALKVTVENIFQLEKMDWK